MPAAVMRRGRFNFTFMLLLFDACEFLFPDTCAGPENADFFLTRSASCMSGLLMKTRIQVVALQFMPDAVSDK